ncbi:hypothetical protein [Synechococcus sp. BIOS-E4-1]|uniref:hypothetical protein n=1 Tax=Synechococcus sp. BIOS-E4-1 TaxID=1400864 RepID=UPI001CA4481C|nr:hypothetical protein [Synechococcus sp. BIOS-E4-1]
MGLRKEAGNARAAYEIKWCVLSDPGASASSASGDNDSAVILERMMMLMISQCFSTVLIA